MKCKKGSTMNSTRWYKINTTLLPVKVFYFLSMAAVGDLLPFIALYMKQIGLSTSDTGIIYGVMPFIGFLVRPLFGSVADKLRRHKLVLALCCVLTGVFYILLLVVPHKQITYTNVRTQILCNQSDSFIHDCYHDNNSSSSAHSCPLTFFEFIKKHTFLSRSNGNTSKDVKYDNINKSLSTDSHNRIVESEGQGHIRCELSCLSTASVTACFTSSEGTYSNLCKVDNGQSFFLDVKSSLAFTLADISSSVRQREIWDHQRSACERFDLQDLSHRGLLHQQMLCSENVQFECMLKCSQITTDCVGTQTRHEANTFWVFFVFYLLGNIFFSPIISIIDAMAYNILQERRNQWGKQRLWGTIGFAVFAVTSTFIMDKISKNPLEIDFSVSFFIFGGLWVFTAICGFFVQASEDIVCFSFLKNVCKLFSYKRFVVFMIVLLYFGILTGAIETFLYWFQQDELDGYLNIIPGLCLLAACTAETFVLYFSGVIMKRLGHLNCLYIVFFAYFLRFLCYSFLTSAWHTLPVELLHGITFGLMWATSTSYASIITPQGMSATVQGLVGGLHFGFGKGIGSLVTGQLYGPLGIRWTFRLYAVLSLVLMLMYMAIQRFIFKSDLTADQPIEKNTSNDICIATTANESEQDQDQLDPSGKQLLQLVDRETQDQSGQQLLQLVDRETQDQSGQQLLQVVDRETWDTSRQKLLTDRENQDSLGPQLMVDRDDKKADQIDSKTAEL